MTKYTINGKTLEVNEAIIPHGTLATKYVADYVPKGSPIKPQRLLNGTGIPKGITVHNTGVVPSKTTQSEQYKMSTYNQNMGGVVVHYYVDDIECWKLLNDNEQGWHAGDGTSRRLNKRGNAQIGGNLDTIAIEAIGENSWDNAVILTAYLCKRYGLNPQYDVYQHKEFATNKKQCPLYFIPKWDKFIQEVTELVNAKEPVKNEHTFTLTTEEIEYLKKIAKKIGLE